MIQLIKNFLNKKKFMIGHSHILNMRKNYSDIKNLNDLDYQIFSQNGEDGIIDYLIYSLEIDKPKFVEIGVGEYVEANTRFLYDRTSCTGLIIDLIEDFEKKVKKNIKMWRGDLHILNKTVNSENIIETLNSRNFLSQLDIFSIDVDGVDYWILEKLPNRFSKIVIAEFNPYFGDKLKITVPNYSDFDRTKYHYSNLYFGVSLSLLIELMEKKGFTFLGTNLFRNNAFFIENELVEKVNIELPKKLDISIHTNAKFRESRDIIGRLNFINKEKTLQEIRDCKVVDLSTEKKELKLISELI